MPDGIEHGIFIGEMVMSLKDRIKESSPNSIVDSENDFQQNIFSRRENNNEKQYDYTQYLNPTNKKSYYYNDDDNK